MIEVSFVSVQPPIGRKVDQIRLEFASSTHRGCVQVTSQPGGNWYPGEAGRWLPFDRALEVFASVVERASSTSGVQPAVIRCDLEWGDLWFWRNEDSGEFVLQQGVPDAVAYPVADTDLASACRKAAQAIRDLTNGVTFESVVTDTQPTPFG